MAGAAGLAEPVGSRLGASWKEPEAEKGLGRAEEPKSPEAGEAEEEQKRAARSIMVFPFPVYLLTY